MGERRFGNTVPKLAGGKWEDVAPYLEEFLHRLQDANDETQESLDVLEVASTGTGEELQTRRPSSHAHRPDEIAGLIGDTQVILASQVFGG